MNARPSEAEPSFGITRVTIDGRMAAVREEVLARRPFATLIRFATERRRTVPCILVIPPLSGHFPALLRDLAIALLPDHDVHVASWVNARDVPLSAGRFALEDNIDYVVEFVRCLGSGVHVLALCQSVVPALCGTALLAARGEPVQPSSLILIEGPVDARRNPTRIERAVRGLTHGRIERALISVVPPRYPGAGRRVYPGDIQCRAFGLYFARHIIEHRDLYWKFVADDGEQAREHPFIKLFLATMNLTAEFFLDTVRLVFQEFALPLGGLAWRGEAVVPASIARTALMTVESEYDDVTGQGQTRAAHDLCRAIPAGRRTHFMLPRAGHFATFHGVLWRAEVMPRVRAFIDDAERAARMSRRRGRAASRDGHGKVDRPRGHALPA
jgi:poly(3-hydroxybutyrate) depolymerase